MSVRIWPECGPQWPLTWCVTRGPSPTALNFTSLQIRITCLPHLVGALNEKFKKPQAHARPSGNVCCI